MAYLLTLPIFVYVIGATFGLPLSLGLGLSVKNGVVYLVGLILCMRIAIRGNYKFEQPLIFACFAIMIIYAIVTWLMAGLVIHYDAYQIVPSAISLKSSLIDNAFIFTLFFFGARDAKDCIRLTKVLVGAVALSNILCILSIEGFVSIHGVAATPGQEGRVQGVYGDANETAALVAGLLPAFVAMVLSDGGIWALLWIVCAIGSIAMLFMTVSRGAFVAMAIAYPICIYTFRRYIALRQVFIWAGALVGLGVVALAAAGPRFVTLFLTRFINESDVSSLDYISSGRSAIWARAIGKMMSYPITLITGFGWNVYDTMGFFYVPHNSYLMMWFELGLVGLLSFVLILFRIVTTTRRAVDVADPVSRSYLIAFVFGFSAFLVAIFFVNTYLTWAYMWAYAALSLRLALCVAEAPQRSKPAADAGTGRVPRRSRRKGVAEPGSGRARPVAGAS
jgi:O-antigen ligase